MLILLRYTSALVHGRQREIRRPACRPAEAALAGLATTLLVALGLAIPLGTLLAEAFQPAHGGFLPLGTLTSLGNSAAYAGVAASLATMLAVALAARAGRSGRLRHVLDIIALGNMAVPGLVLGAAYIIAFNNAWAPLYGTPLLLVIGYVATHAPMLVRFLQPALGQLHVNLADAGRVHGLRFTSRLRRIHIRSRASRCSGAGASFQPDSVRASGLGTALSRRAHAAQGPATAARHDPLIMSAKRGWRFAVFSSVSPSSAWPHSSPPTVPPGFAGRS